MNLFSWKAAAGVCVASVIGFVAAQTPPQDGRQRPPQEGEQRQEGRRGFDQRGGGERGGPEEGRGFGRGGFGGPGGPGGDQPDREILKKFDHDKSDWLNEEERKEAREFLKSDEGAQQGGRGFGGRRGGRGGPGGGRGQRQPATPGPKVSPADVKPVPGDLLYEQTAFRTIFLEFANEDWEKELEEFHGTDVDVAAQLTVDGKTYPNVGIRFRGKSSYGMIPTGHKRSFNISMDMADEDQRLYGYKSLNLLNSNGDPSMMSTVLYSEIGQQFLPVPKSNHVRVVVNGESWGVYVNVQQFDKIFLKEHFESSKGTRWKVSGSPNGDGGLRYFGEDLEEYQRRYEMKSSDGKKAWTALKDLSKVLNETPLDQLVEKLDPVLDIDGALKFLALDVALVNSDGYWTRASDYSIFRDKNGKFHLIPHDMNEAFQSGHGGGPGGPGRGGPGQGGPGQGGPGFGPPGFGPPGGGFGGPGFGPPPEGPPGEGGPGFGPPPGRDGPGFGGPPQEGQGPEGRGAREERGGRGQEEGADRRGRERGGRERGGFGQGGPGGGGPGRGGPGGGPGHGGVDLDPLVSIDNPRMALRARLLAIPELRTRYLQYVQQIADKSLDWKNIGPVIERQAEVIREHVAADTRKLSSTEDFEKATDPKATGKDAGSLRSFFDQRREYLLNYQSKDAK